MPDTKKRKATRRSRPSIGATFFFATLAPVVAGGCIIGSLWIASEYRLFRAEVEREAREVVQRQQRRLQAEVEDIVDHIRYEQSRAHELLRDRLRQRVDQVGQIMEHLHRVLAAPGSAGDTLAAVVEALRPIRFRSASDYVFVIRSDGLMLLNPARPELEGLTVDALPYAPEDIRRLMSIARANGEGFSHYYWPKPGQSKLSPKLAFVRMLERSGCVIGTGEYLDDLQHTVQDEIVLRMERITFGEDGYVFAGDWQGNAKAGPGKGDNVLDLTDANGLKVVRELIRTARSGGGFVTHVMPPFPGKKPADKISFVIGVPEWQWYVGAGMYVQDIERELAPRRKALAARMARHVGQIILTLAAIAVASYAVAGYVRRRTEGSFQVFGRFFHEAAERTAISIDPETIHFADFAQLADSAERMVVARDHAEKEAARLRSFLHNIIDSMPSAVVAVDTRGCVTQWNREASRITGVDAQHAAGRALDQVFPQLAPEMPKVMAAIARKATVKDPKRQWADGAEVHYNNVTIYPLVGEDVRGAVIRVDDVTESVRMEEIMIQSEKMLSVGGLAAGMAHEINNPLAAMCQNAQNALRRVGGDLPANHAAAAAAGTTMQAIRAFMEKRRIVAMLETIVESGNRAARIVENMLSFSRRSTAGTISCDIIELIEDAVQLASKDYDLSKRYDFRNILVKKEFELDVVKARCVPGEIQQVFLNILRNGAEAMSGVGSEVENWPPAEWTPQLTLRVRRDARDVVIEIADNGPGLDADTRRRVFEPFFTTKEVGAGTGLGLSVSYFIVVEKHGGVMTVSSKPRQGATFTIRLPVDGAAAADRRRPPSRERAALPAANSA